MSTWSSVASPSSVPPPPAAVPAAAAAPPAALNNDDVDDAIARALSAFDMEDETSQVSPTLALAANRAAGAAQLLGNLAATTNVPQGHRTNVSEE